LFIGKKELTKLPIFGYFYKKTNILVDRKSIRSRQEVYQRAAERLDENIGLCIFPEGGVPDPEVELARFKNGAFRLAVEKQIPIIPVSYPDNKKHFPFDFKKGKPGVLRAEIHEFLYPEEGGSLEVERLKEECFQTIAEGLRQPSLSFG